MVGYWTICEQLIDIPGILLHWTAFGGGNDNVCGQPSKLLIAWLRTECSRAKVPSILGISHWSSVSLKRDSSSPAAVVCEGCKIGYHT